ncbi:hypothetical protein MESS2_880004 [Mesorhizobium metallidurans STM 2683]|uniref:Uncharacterized protein n=2 Tax=Mesorhizobium metallidurans TaxID=489722 RepID=M5EVY0_9HYPH|nr:hypothetical protein MESS2_880004 [Mesorhizobium metallidurans STM 2683]
MARAAKTERSTRIDPELRGDWPFWHGGRCKDLVVDYADAFLTYVDQICVDLQEETLASADWQRYTFRPDFHGI